MIDTKELLKVVDRHKKLVQDTRVFLRSKDGTLLVASSNLSGVVLRTRVAADTADFRALVSVDALIGALKATKQAVLSASGGRLFVKGKGMKADMPIEPGDAPVLPKLDEANNLSRKIVSSLRDAIPRVDIPRLAKSGQLSVRCRDGELFVACTDDVHGAVFRGKGTGDLELGVFPQDAGLLTNALVHDDVSIVLSEGSIILSSKGEYQETVVIPTVECAYIPADDSSAKRAARIAVSDLREVLTAVSPITSADESSPVKIVLDTDKGARVEVSSSVGTLSKKLNAKVFRTAAFGVSHVLLNDLSSKMSGTVDLGIFVEEGEVARVQFDCDGVVYAALTDGEK